MTALLNIGCGATFHPDWINLDSAPVSPKVRAHDIATGLPFADGHFQAVYASHVLEHLDPEAGMRLLRECLRVLRPGGIVRIVVPDLEAIARTYLESLEAAANGDRGAEARYDWMMLELYDQTVRTTSGGRMAAYLAGALDERQRRFIAERIGDEAVIAPQPAPSRRPSRRLSAACLSFLLGSKRATALEEARFRRSGELHRWMYDRFSLARALTRAGFTDTRKRSADESGIERFASFGLESVAGRPRKPDSLYVEGRKPL
jgi:predicted SAM-dependent methyltransferase